MTCPLQSALRIPQRPEQTRAASSLTYPLRSCWASVDRRCRRGTRPLPARPDLSSSPCCRSFSSSDQLTVSYSYHGRGSGVQMRPTSSVPGTDVAMDAAVSRMNTDQLAWSAGTRRQSISSHGRRLQGIDPVRHVDQILRRLDDRTPPTPHMGYLLLQCLVAGDLVQIAGICHPVVSYSSDS